MSEEKSAKTKDLRIPTTPEKLVKAVVKGEVKRKKPA